MKILVTGGAGFIGSNFIRYWLHNHPDDQILSLDKLTYAGNLENLKDIQENSRYQFVKGDICDSQLVNDLVKDVDQIVHFAAESHVDRSITNSTPFIVTNVVGTQVLLDAAVKNGNKRFHHVSTDEVFGSLDLDSNDAFTENTRYNPHSPYSASKAASDHLVRAFGDTFNLPYSISNCSNNFGPYQFPEKFLPLMICNILDNKKIPVYGDGKYVRDWLHVDDHCRAIDLIITSGKNGERYCIGGMTESVSNLDLVKKVLTIMGKDETMIEFVKDRPAHDRRYAIDFSKAKNELGYEPRCSFDDYLKTTVDWYVQNKEWVKNIRSGEYQKHYIKHYTS